MLPVSVKDEDFSVVIGEEATKSKFVFDNGKYPATCTEFGPGTTRNGDPKFVLEFTGTGGAAKGNTFKLHLSLSPKAQWKLLEVMSAFDIAMDPVTRSLPITKAKIVGKSVDLVLAAEEKDNGKTYMEIQAVEAPRSVASGTPAPIRPF